MTKIEVESFSNAISAAVIRLPGRKFPEIVLQGDSLKILMSEAEDLSIGHLRSSPSWAEFKQISNESLLLPGSRFLTTIWTYDDHCKSQRNLYDYYG